MPHTQRHAKSPPLLKSIATVSLSGGLPEKLEAAAAVGFDAVEMFENDLLTFEDRFFFEIVQRRGYRGFGAVNAGVRMAAQAGRRGISTLML